MWKDLFADCFPAQLGREAPGVYPEQNQVGQAGVETIGDRQDLLGAGSVDEAL
jgi:hypothetical protein